MRCEGQYTPVIEGQQENALHPRRLTMFGQATGVGIQPSQHSQRSASLLALAGLFTFGCIGAIEPVPAPMATIMILVSTAGPGIDSDGYTLSTDSRSAQPVGINAQISVGSLVRGEHVVRLNSVSPNCSIANGGHVRSVDVGQSAPASPLSVSFSVWCAKGGDATGGWDY